MSGHGEEAHRQLRREQRDADETRQELDQKQRQPNDGGIDLVG